MSIRREGSAFVVQLGSGKPVPASREALDALIDAATGLVNGDRQTVRVDLGQQKTD